MKAGFYSALHPTQRAGEGFVGKEEEKKKLIAVSHLLSFQPFLERNNHSKTCRLCSRLLKGPLAQTKRGFFVRVNTSVNKEESGTNPTTHNHRLCVQTKYLMENKKEEKKTLNWSRCRFVESFE